MHISKRLEKLLKMMENISENFDNMNPVTRRMLAIGLITEMQQVVEDLDTINTNLDNSLSEDDASLDPSIWESWSFNFRLLLNEKQYSNESNGDTIINKMIDFFPLDNKDYDFTSKHADKIKTGLRSLNSNANINQRNITYAIEKGVKEIFSLLFSIREKKKKIQPFQYVDYWYEFLFRDDDLYSERAIGDFERWKENHDIDDIQVLKDKRTQEILKLLQSGVFAHQPIVNRDKQNCLITIPEAALETGTDVPDNIDEECAKMSKFVKMEEDILCLDYLGLGKYLYRHHNEITYEEGDALIYFSFLLDLIHEEMTVFDPSLKQYLSWHDEDQQEEDLEYAISVICSCNKFLKEGVPEDFLKNYITAAYSEGDAKIEVQTKLSRKSKKYKLIGQMLGMLKTTLKVFKTDTTAPDIAKALHDIVPEKQLVTFRRYVDEGAGDHQSKLSKWTTLYVNDKLGSKADRIFLRL